MKKFTCILCVAFGFALGCYADNTLTPHQPTGSFSKLNHFPAVKEAKRWKATDWDADAWAGFGGKPSLKASGHNCELIQHRRYVVEYDTDLLNPRWVAHIDTKESAKNTQNRPNSNPAWKRPSKFSPDPFLVKVFEIQSIPFVRHEDFSSTGYSRGHMCPNAEMKGFDQDSQVESFFTSNICPQLQDHNGGIWAALEADCLKWAEAFEKVYVITGPIFRDPEHPTQTTKGGGRKNKVPVPNQFFKVLIAEKDGNLIAAGFLIDHANGLKKRDLFKYEVAVDDIEKATGIDFMPLLGEPNAVETEVGTEWKNVVVGN